MYKVKGVKCIVLVHCIFFSAIYGSALQCISVLHYRVAVQCTASDGIWHKLYMDRILGKEFYPIKYRYLWPFLLINNVIL